MKALLFGVQGGEQAGNRILFRHGANFSDLAYERNPAMMGLTSGSVAWLAFGRFEQLEEFPDGDDSGAGGSQVVDHLFVVPQVSIAGDEVFRFRGHGQGNEDVIARIAADGDDRRIGEVRSVLRQTI